jgi:hypothetical protein
MADGYGQFDAKGYWWSSNIGLTGLGTPCPACYCQGYHSSGCIYSSNYSVKLTNGGNKMATTNSVIEVVLVTEDEDGDLQVAFGPKAFAATNLQAAIVKATGEFVGGGGDASKVVNALTRFFG